MKNRAFMEKLSLCAVIGLLSLSSATGFAASTVDLKVLVISTGPADRDQGLDLIDDLLDEVGVAYDVLDSSSEELTPERLSNGEHGFYNGIIVTDAILYYTGSGNTNNSGFTLAEWQTLHAYERDFGVRESVISGFPASGAYFRNTYDLDYGMNLDTRTTGSSFVGVWQSPAGGTEIFEYVNTTNSVPINDFTIAASPSGDIDGPVVEPLLTDQSTGQALVSHLTYADGREVLYSGITNAWYLIYSQVLNYEFLNFATKGVFLGSRKVYLAAHVDDLFLADGLWNPETNTTDDEPGYRNTAGDIATIVSAQQSLLATHATLSDFKLDMVFNGSGTLVPPTQTLISDADTWIREGRPRRNYGTRSNGYFEQQWGTSERVLIHFPVTSSQAISNQALLNLRGTTNTRPGKVCKATTQWVEREATWRLARSGVSWSSNGGSYDSASCINFTLSGGRASVNVTSIVNEWAVDGQPNYGFIVIGANRSAGWIRTREYSNSSYRPQLVISYGIDVLTNAVVENMNEFRFINHTYTHHDMYTSAGTTYTQAYDEIFNNQIVWQDLGFPEFNENISVLVTGNHSGLDDTNGTEGDPSLWTPYPEAMNTEFMAAAQALGVRYLASDASRVNQNVEAYVPGYDILLLPRYPTSLFYNTSTPEELTDEYNYIFYERHVAAGNDPCSIPGAICQPRSYQEILDAEADTTLRHMMTYRSWPHYFHISNLRDYGSGATLQFDWLGAVMSRYEQYFNLPVINDAYYNIGQRAEARIAAKAASVNGELELSTGLITLTSSANTSVEVTGIVGGELYGGQRMGNVDVSAIPVTIAVDQALAE